VRRQTTRTDDLPLGPNSSQHLVNDLVWELAADLIRHRFQDPRMHTRQLAWRLAAGATPIRDSGSN
jgi:hypothetical protein